MRITIVDDHVLFAEAVALTLEHHGYAVRRVDLTDPGATLASVLSATLRTVPRLVLLDLCLGRVGDGTRLVAPLAASGAVVVVLTGSLSRPEWGECLHRGARAVLLKSSSLNQIIGTMRRARDGLALMPAGDRAELIAVAARHRSDTHDISSRLERLTRREAEVLGALMRGMQVRDIARVGVVSEATVRTQVKTILAKLDLTSQLAAVGAAHKVGWRSPGP
ncbi:response regulator transcription factor [Nocardioides nitrophenolicus]|uniref:response regulator transcription factor n=1 Tax=Nocardioides nitrophenolicus TaxID=60489 RepID=UPI001EF909E2|nr:response regulator transcription factor [Nocardioides nitrophenolicus]MBM7518257.1 DNA-binding NarL/FixJ family response regulator [Nocardioides nitrophenolicus]